jgi:ATP-dependent DNA helicase RecG
MFLYQKFLDIEGLGVGEKTFSKLKKLGIETPHDLFYFYPRRYEDYTQITKIGDLSAKIKAQEIFTIRGAVLGIANKKTRRRGFTVTEAVFSDESGTIKVVWFNQPYLVKMLTNDREIILHGKVHYDYFSHGLIMESPTRALFPKIVPIYSETAGLSSYFISKIFSKTKKYISGIKEWLPELVIAKHKLLSLQDALLNIHEPEDALLLKEAERRLAFNELFLIAFRNGLVKKKAQHLKAPLLRANIDLIKTFVGKLPFQLTDDQRKAIWQIVKDFDKGVPMHRLLNGDVGSGKTIVAVISSMICARAGYKTLVMAPTEILACQHYDLFKKLLLPYKISVGLVTASSKVDLKSDVLIGTHALISGKMNVANIGLVIVDEQHRFGVKQRQALTSRQSDFQPHFLSMTATPIPRTLHLALFGDLDISIIHQKPALRQEIVTKFVRPFDRMMTYEFIQKQIDKGRQVFVICPLIEDQQSSSNSQQNSERLSLNFSELDRKSVKAEFDKLKKVFPKDEIAMLHGKMKSKEKNAIMTDFVSCKTKLLVSTSVIEVGIDVPNATVMVIEDAEKFGLAQIHQFRGRVGRSNYQSYCFLFSATESEKALSRLTSLEKISDGFELAEIDLKSRGPGSIFGTEQSGVIDLKMASISDTNLIIEATEAASEIVKSRQDYPQIEKMVAEFSQSNHLE